MRSRLNKIFFAGSLLFLVVSCSNGEDLPLPDPDAGREKTVVDIAISLSDGWDIDEDGTRAAPPSSTEDYNSDSYEDIKEVDKVRVVTFRRKEGDEGEFYYDMQNDQTLTVEKESGESEDIEHAQHSHRFAKGKLTKTYGYEYRVVAIAYDSERSTYFTTSSGIAIPPGEDNWMKIKDKVDDLPHTYSDLCVKLATWDCSQWNDYLKESSYGSEKDIKHINKEILETPQIFYSTLVSQYRKSEIIPYAEEDENGEMNSKTGLTGILKRGVAKIELTITPQPEVDMFNQYHIQWITILAQTPTIQVGLTTYDDFLKPTAQLGVDGKYTAISYIPVGGSGGENQPRTISFWLLPCKTRLAIRVKSIKEDWSSTVHLRNGQLIGSDVELHGDNGTGIVSPDFVDGVFYFRRNHKYVITVKSSESVVTGHPLN